MATLHITDHAHQRWGERYSRSQPLPSYYLKKAADRLFPRKAVSYVVACDIYDEQDDFLTRAVFRPSDYGENVMLNTTILDQDMLGSPHINVFTTYHAADNSIAIISQ